MARFTIKSYDGQSDLYVGQPKYHGLFGKPSYLEFARISSPVPINFNVGDYVDYTRTGFRYYLYSVPRPARHSANAESGEAFVYENVQFFCKTEDLAIAPFRDLILSSTGIQTFSTVANVATYENVHGIAARIQANLDDFCGAGVWEVRVYSHEAINPTLNEVKAFSVSDASILDALNQIYNLWLGIGWVYSNEQGLNVITIGRPNVQSGDNTTDVFYYGKGHGMTVLTSAVSSKNDIATRIFAYGSDRNMPTRYYKDIFDAEKTYIPHLMIPTNYWGKTSNLPDARKAYLENTAMKEVLGLRVKTIRFDGSADYDEIYPSIEGMTFGELRAAEPEYTPSSQYADSDRVDELKAVSNPTDSGIVNTDGEKYSELLKGNINGAERDFEGVAFLFYEADTFSIGTATKIGNVTVDLSGIRYTLTDIGSITTEINANLQILIGGNIVFNKSLPVSIDGDTIAIPLGTHTFSTTETGAVTVSVNIDGALTQITDISYYFKRNVSEQPSYGVSNRVLPTFTVTLKQIGFDISKQAATDNNVRIEMKTGACAGRSFMVNKCIYNSETDDWTLTLKREEDTSIGQVFPNVTYRVAAGDRFVVTGIMMPDLYVEAASARLYTQAVKVLNAMSKPKIVFTPQIDAKVLAESQEHLIEGMYMMVYDADLIDTTDHYTFVLIDSLTIDEGQSNIPVYTASLRDEKATSLIEKITGETADNAIRLANLENQGDRLPYDPSIGGGDNILAPVVNIVSDTLTFAYPDEEGSAVPSEIVLSCELKNLTATSFQWRYYVEGTGWVNISGATSATYAVSPSGAYFPEGDRVARIGCLVNNAYTADVTITKIIGGVDALNVMLSATALTFPGEVDHAIAKTITVDVIAVKGGERQVTSVGTITGGITGKIGTTILNNNTTQTQIRVAIQNTCDVLSGEFIIPVTSGGVTYSLLLTWTVSTRGYKGDEGDDGVSSVEIRLYKRSLSPSTLQVPQGNYTYNFQTGALTPTGTGGLIEGWSLVIPSGADPCYVTTARKRAAAETVAVTKDDWSVITRLTGDNGLRGKVMRGINRYSENGLPTATGEPSSEFDIERDYQGLDDTETNLFYYDMVYIETTDSVTDALVRKFYFCKVKEKGGVLARLITPGTDSDVWVEATAYDFVSTRVLLAQNGFIDILSGNGVYMYGTDGTTVTAGMQGGSQPTDVNFFAGANGKSNINQAVFRVLNNGTMYAGAGIFAGSVWSKYVGIRTAAPYDSARYGHYLNEIYTNIKWNYGDSQGDIYLPTPSQDISGLTYNFLINPYMTKTPYPAFRICVNGGSSIIVFYPGSYRTEVKGYDSVSRPAGAGGFLQLLCDGNNWYIIFSTCLLNGEKDGETEQVSAILGSNSAGGIEVINQGDTQEEGVLYFIRK